MFLDTFFCGLSLRSGLDVAAFQLIAARHGLVQWHSKLPLQRVDVPVHRECQVARVNVAYSLLHSRYEQFIFFEYIGDFARSDGAEVDGGVWRQMLVEHKDAAC